MSLNVLAGRLARLPLSAFMTVETNDDEWTFATGNGELMSMLRFNGLSTIRNNASEYNQWISDLYESLSANFVHPGHVLDLIYTNDPEAAARRIAQHQEPMRRAAQTIGLDCDDIIDDTAQAIGRFVSDERMHIVLWTTKDALTGQEAKIAKRSRAAQPEWFLAPEAQNPYTGTPELRSRHHATLEALQRALSANNAQTELLTCHQAADIMRQDIDPYHVPGAFRPLLVGDPIRNPQVPDDAEDYSALLWPTLSRQVVNVGAERVDRVTMRIRERYYRTCEIELWPRQPSSFQQLVERLRTNQVPYRYRVCLQGAALQSSVAMRESMAAVLKRTSDLNRRLMHSLQDMKQLAESETTIKLRGAFTTWSHDLSALDRQEAAIISAVGQWGEGHAVTIAADPVAAFASTTTGWSRNMTAPWAAAPLLDALKMMPWQRPASPWQTGPTLWRSPDGRIYPFDLMDSRMASWFTTIYARPGAGKSVTMNSLLQDMTVASGQRHLPMIALIDIGSTSEGFIDMMRHALPIHRQHEAQHIRLQMLPEFANNPFDTPLGCRQPLPEHRDALRALFATICIVGDQEAMNQLSENVISEMYRIRSDKEPEAQPRRYTPRQLPDVDDALAVANISLPNNPLWWDVVDMLFLAGDLHHAALAQRYAVPTLADASRAASATAIADMFAHTTVGGNSSEPLHMGFGRSISAAIKRFPILARPTVFEISAETRICAVDLKEVAPQGSDAALQQTALVYLLARHLLTKNWWVTDAVYSFSPSIYHKYYQKKLAELIETNKIISFDEVHRLEGVASARERIVRDGRESRKAGVAVIVTSQRIGDVEYYLPYATTRLILGNDGNEKENNLTVEAFGLSKSAETILRTKLTGPGSKGAPFLAVISAKESGTYEQFLMNTLGPIKLWALTTDPKDSPIRRRVTAALGAQAARKALARSYPGGSARREYDSRRSALGLTDDQDDTDLLDRMADEVIAAARKV